MRVLVKISYIVFALVLFPSLSAAAADYEYEIRDDWINLPDGVRLSVTYYIPISQQANERFPVLLEMLPYRKDDLSKPSAHPMYDYFARQGLALAKVDVRGTGSSEGQLPTREYSAQEIDDGVAVIAALAELPYSNGNIGMWGISWGGFNSIQVALRNPPQLKAILAAHASDDLYTNDVHYTDGIFGLDEYILSINHLTGFMRSPKYVVDEEYFSDRFDREPWIFNYIRNKTDGDFWRKGSLKWQYENLNIPVYLIGGLLDGYRDTLPHVLENSTSPVRAILGPWPHAWPHSVAPGPDWEWRADASQWWSHWLTNKPNSQNEEFETNSFRVFLRSGENAIAGSEILGGRWIEPTWPIAESHIDSMSLYPGANSSLQAEIPNSETIAVTLNNNPGAGIELGEWWGELLPDMSIVDGDAMVFDSEPVAEALTLIGEPSVSLEAASNAADGNWVVRLEDVSPDGIVTKITGGAINGQLRNSRFTAEVLIPNQFYQLQIPLRMTTWTFKPGHQIRLAVSNSAFPMFWPSALLSASSLRINTAATRIEVPVLNNDTSFQELGLAGAGTSNYLPAEVVSMSAVAGHPSSSEVIENPADDSISYRRQSGVTYSLEDHSLMSTRFTQLKANRKDPANTEYEAWAEYNLQETESDNSFTKLRTEIALSSDEEFFHVEVTRILSDEKGEVRTRHWNESIARGFQ